jgi:hypothetical protein
MTLVSSEGLTTSTHVGERSHHVEVSAFIRLLARSRSSALTALGKSSKSIRQGTKGAKQQCYELPCLVLGGVGVLGGLLVQLGTPSPSHPLASTAARRRNPDNRGKAAVTSPPSTSSLLGRTATSDSARLTGKSSAHHRAKIANAVLLQNLID